MQATAIVLRMHWHVARWRSAHSTSGPLNIHGDLANICTYCDSFRKFSYQLINERPSSSQIVFRLLQILLLRAGLRIRQDFPFSIFGLALRLYEHAARGVPARSTATSIYFLCLLKFSIFSRLYDGSGPTIEYLQPSFWWQ